MNKLEKNTAQTVDTSQTTEYAEARQTAAMLETGTETNGGEAEQVLARMPEREHPPRMVQAADTAGQSDGESNLDYFVDKVRNPDTKQYIRTRVVDQMDYYRRQSRAYKKQYFRFMTVSIILGALIPIVSIFSDSTTFMKFLIAALGSAVTAINAYLGLNNSRDLWLSYRNSRQTLLQTLYYYFNNTNTFEKIDTQEEKDKLLIQSCEKELSQQHSGWRTLVEE